jgi:uncharacterized DUF497 family protein
MSIGVLTLLYIHFNIDDMEYTWDPEKNRINQSKHGVSFETAVVVFDDPFHLSKLDRIVDGEERWITLGEIFGTVILIVAHTCREENGIEKIRIISARKATKQERKRYHDEEMW